MICPNCGAELPDTATLCWSCRKKFNQNSEESKPDPIQTYKLSFKDEEPKPETTTVYPTQGNPITDQPENEPEKYVPFNNIKRKSYMIKASLLGIVGVLFLFAIHFKLLYMPLYYMFKSGEFVAYAVVPLSLVFLVHLILFIYSIPGRKYLKSDGTGKAIISLLGIIVTIVISNKLFSNTNVQLSYDDKYVFFVIKLFIYAGYGFNLISGIMLYAAGYTKDEKEKMKNNR